MNTSPENVDVTDAVDFTWLRRIGIGLAFGLWAVLAWMAWHGAFRGATWSMLIPGYDLGPHYAKGTGGFVVVAVGFVALLSWARAYVAAAAVGFFVFLFGGWYLLTPFV